MEFEIIVHIEGKPYRIQVRRTYEGDSIEKWAVTGGKRGILLRNNRPEIKRLGSRKKPVWKIEEGEMPSSAQAFALMVLAIEKKIDEIENPPKPPKRWQDFN